MKLYHITLEVGEEKEIFEPRDIITGRDEEPKFKKRTCFADSVENCLNLVAWAEKYRIEDIFLLLNNDFFSIPIRVYEFEVDEKDEYLVCPDEVYKSGVIDAQKFNEFWYLKPIKPISTYVVTLDETYQTESVNCCAYMNDNGYNVDEVNRFLKENPDSDEDEFYESFYSFYKEKNYDFDIRKTEIIKPVEYRFEEGYQVYEIKLSSDKDIDEDEILEILEDITSNFQEQTLKIIFDIDTADNNTFRVHVNTVFFGISKEQFEIALSEKNIALAC